MIKEIASLDEEVVKNGAITITTKDDITNIVSNEDKQSRVTITETSIRCSFNNNDKIIKER